MKKKRLNIGLRKMETAKTPADLFSAEKALFESKRSSLAKTHLGKFVLIHDKEVVGVFDSEQNALNEGYEKFGPVPLYIRQIAAEEVVQSAPALAFGILSMQ